MATKLFKKQKDADLGIDVMMKCKKYNETKTPSAAQAAAIAGLREYAMIQKKELDDQMTELIKQHNQLLKETAKKEVSIWEDANLALQI